MFKYEKECKVGNEKGIHGRPSNLIVSLANQMTGGGGVFIRKKENGNPISASSIMSVMSLGAVKGTELVVFTNDRRFKDAVDKVAELILNMQNFDDD